MIFTLCFPKRAGNTNESWPNVWTCNRLPITLDRINLLRSYLRHFILLEKTIILVPNLTVAYTLKYFEIQSTLDWDVKYSSSLSSTTAEPQVADAARSKVRTSRDRGRRSRNRGTHFTCSRWEEVLAGPQLACSRISATHFLAACGWQGWCQSGWGRPGEHIITVTLWSLGRPRRHVVLWLQSTLRFSVDYIKVLAKLKFLCTLEASSFLRTPKNLDTLLGSNTITVKIMDLTGLTHFT